MGLEKFDKFKVYDNENLMCTKSRFAVIDGKAQLTSGSQGICGGQSVIWCSNVLAGKRGADTKPSYMRAAALQARFEKLSTVVYADAAYLEKEPESVQEAIGKHGEETMFEATGVRLLAEISKPMTDAVWHMMSSDNPGAYLIGAPGHFMAASTKPGEYMFFNPDHGMWSLGMFDFESLVTLGRKNMTWKLFKLGAG
jgi:hypothetical protein